MVGEAMCTAATKCRSTTNNYLQHVFFHIMVQVQLEYEIENMTNMFRR